METAWCRAARQQHAGLFLCPPVAAATATAAGVCAFSAPAPAGSGSDSSGPVSAAPAGGGAGGAKGEVVTGIGAGPPPDRPDCLGAIIQSIRCLQYRSVARLLEDVKFMVRVWVGLLSCKGGGCGWGAGGVGDLDCAVRCGLMRCGAVWCGLVRFGAVRCGAV